MKTLNQFIKAALITQTLSFHAFANEDTWLNKQIQLPTLSNRVDFFLTNSNSLRLSHVYDTEGKVKISGGLLKGGLSQAQAKCQTVGEGIRQVAKSSERRYIFEAFINPLAKQEISTLNQTVENLPLSQTYELKLKLNSLAVTDHAQVQDFERRINSFIQDKSSDISMDGTLKVSVDKIDDVICDLVSGNASLMIKESIVFSAAKKTREPIISSNELQTIYDQLSSKTNKATSIEGRTLIASAQLSQALSEKLGKNLDDFGQDNFIKLSQTLYTGSSKVLNKIQSSEFYTAARSLDNLTQHTDAQSFQLNLQTEVVCE